MRPKKVTKQILSKKQLFIFRIKILGVFKLSQRGRTYHKIHLKRNQHVTKSLRK